MQTKASEHDKKGRATDFMQFRQLRAQAMAQVLRYAHYIACISRAALARKEERDALVDLSVEKKEGSNGKQSSCIRIRSKAQGIALSLATASPPYSAHIHLNCRNMFILYLATLL